MNKIKRFAAAALVMTMAVSAAGPVYAEKSKDYKYSNVDAYVHGYVDFESYFGGLITKVWCNVSLGGPDRAAVTARYSLKTDKKVIANNKKLDYGNLKDSYTKVSGGAGASYAKLIIKYDGKGATLTDK